MGGCRGYIRKKRGAATVLLCMVLSCLLLLVGMFGEASAALASRPYANAIFDLAGRSILSEYDRGLKDRYGIFGFRMEEEEVEHKLANYLQEGFSTGAGKTSLLSLRLEEIRVDLSEHVLTNAELLEQQILEIMGGGMLFGALHVLDALELIDNGGRSWAKEKEKQKGDSSDDGRDDDNDDEGGTHEKNKRVLRNGKIIQGLPSRLLAGIDGGFKSILELPSPSEFGQMAFEEICINLYILKYFRHSLDDPQWNNTFFSNEIEYILCGRLSDETNQNIVYLSLLAFRTAMNAAHIRSDTEKWEAVTLAAALAGGGAATPAAQAAIVAIWAGAEAAVDMSRLEKGEKVPLIKTAEDWVLSLENAIEGIMNEAGESPEEQEGLDYEDYLFLLLCFKDKESKLIRIMDLIQLNLKGTADEDFDMSRCYSGFSFRSKVKRTSGFPGVLNLRSGEFSGIHVY
jgi:hypothetical protein